MKITPINSILAKNLRYFKIFIIDGKYKIIKISLNLFNSLIFFNILYILKYKFLNILLHNRFDTDDCEVDDSEGEDDEVNGNEDGDGDANEEDSEEG